MQNIINATTSSSVQKLTISDSSAGQRLDNFLLKKLKGAPRSLIYKIVRKGEVRVNSKRVDVGYKISTNDVIRIPPIRLSPDNNNLPSHIHYVPEILFEDDYFVIVNKPQGMAVHGGSGISFGLIELLRIIRSGSTLELAHRLDKETSGCLVVTKKSIAIREFGVLMQARQISKQYHALVDGVIDANVTIDKPLKKNILSSGERFVKVDPDGVDAITEVSPIKIFKDYTLVNANLVTGKTHQIRVHLQSIGHPIVNDEKYNFRVRGNSINPLAKFKRMFLHAHSLRFVHPITKQDVNVVAPYDRALISCVKILEDIS